MKINTRFSFSKYKSFFSAPVSFSSYAVIKRKAFFMDITSALMEFFIYPAISGRTSVVRTIVSNKVFLLFLFFGLSVVTPFFAQNTDGDSLVDTLDFDDDNDGILDSIECPVQNAQLPDTNIGGNPKEAINETEAITYTITTKPEITISKDGGGTSLITTLSGGNTTSTVIYTFPKPITSLEIFLGNMAIGDESFQNFSNTPASVTGDFQIVGVTVVPLVTDGLGSIVFESLPPNTTTISFDYVSTATGSNHTIESLRIGLDTDGDGIPDCLDTDSDNDMCPDAIEGTANFDQDDIDANGRLTSPVDPLTGIPGIAGAGQGYSTDIVIVGPDINGDGTTDSCDDSDGDTVNDDVDLDNDNDGILDSDECTVTLLDGLIIVDSNTVRKNNTAVDVTISSSTYGASQGPGVFIDTALFFGGSDLESVITFSFSRPIATFRVSLRDLDYQTAIPQILEFADTFSIPPTAVGGDFNFDGTTVNPTMTNSVGTIIWDTLPLGTTSISFTARRTAAGLGFFVLDMAIGVDNDSDGIADCFDTDSDNDGCPDAVEGIGTFTTANLDVDDSLGDVVDTDPTSPNSGVPTIAGSPQATTAAVLAAGPDLDGDGIADGCDPVDNLDYDMDGVPNLADFDDDNDGILDVDESGVFEIDGDEDGDGIPNYMDVVDNGDVNVSPTDYTDSNGDGIADVFDADGDGIPNHLDIDADNDGIPDNVEAQPTVGYLAPLATTPAEYIANNGVNNAYLTTNAGGPGLDITSPTVNNDTDGIPDYLDIDADNDGIPDNVEAQTTAVYMGPSVLGDGDMDDDGLNDQYDPDFPTSTPITAVNLVDTDANTTENLPDYRDSDSDDDGLTDLAEAGQLISGGVPDPMGDIDNDGLLNQFDVTNTVGMSFDVNDNLDAGASDTLDTAIATMEVDFRELMDSDLDGIPDLADLDDDNDGILDENEEDCSLVMRDLISTGYGLNTDFVTGGPTPGAINDLAPYKTANMDLSFVNVLGASWATDGVQIREGNGSGGGSNGIPVGENFIYLQGNNTNYNNDGVLVFTLKFNQLVANLSFYLGGLDNTDTARFEAFNNGQSLGVTADNFSDLNTPIQLSPNEIFGVATPGSSNFVTNQVKFNVATAVDEIRLTFGKIDNTVGNSIITLALYDMNYCIADTDGDGVINTLDLDSDNDGILDNIEAQTSNTDLTQNGGVVFVAPSGVGTGITDNNDNGVDDNYESATGIDLGTGVNSDMDTSPDYLDIDADNDGIPDNVEAQATDPTLYIAPSVIFVDLNSNGVDDIYDATPLVVVNTDSAEENSLGVENIPDYRDTDSDNDGLPDVTESGLTDNGSVIDSDGDGLLDTFEGADPNDGFDVNNEIDVPSADLPDLDGDVLTGGDVDYRDVMDFDMDGVPDLTDLDDDNDGIPDALENPFGVDPSADNDMDGIPNYLDKSDPLFLTVFPGGRPCPDTTPMDGICDSLESFVDFDGDGIPNHLDLDSDNDGIYDVIESGNADAIAGDVNSDGRVDGPVGINGIPNAAEGGTEGGIIPPAPNTDQNGGANFLDIDSDNDGIPDNVEAQATGNYQAPIGDGNNNGVDDAYENITGVPLVPVDTDDPTGATPDYIDTDSDNDGIADVTEAGQGTFLGADDDGDGLDNGFEGATLNDGFDVNDDLNFGASDTTDTDNMGEVDFRDVRDSDNDGIPDLADLDDDNDGITDVEDCTIYFGPTGVAKDISFVSYTTADVPSGASLALDAAASSVTNGGAAVATPTTATIYPNGLNYIEGVSQAFGNPAFDLTIDDVFPDFAGNNVELLATDALGSLVLSVNDPEGGSFSANIDAPDFGGFADSAHFEFTTTFVIDDLAKYEGFFLEHREYADAGSVVLSINGNPLIDLIDTNLSTHTNYEEDPLETATLINIDPALLITGTNMIRIIIDEESPSLNLGIVGFAGFGRFGGYLDTDGDGISNCYDLDADNDGIYDVVETGNIANDRNRDGRIDDDDTGNVNVGSNGIPNVVEVGGVDGGGVPDAVNSDGDIFADFKDIDSDNDGIPDNVEAQTTNNDVAMNGGIVYIQPSLTFADSDGNGVDDVYDTNGAPLTPQNTDQAIEDANAEPNVPDYIDTDSDEDGIDDVLEAGELIPGRVLTDLGLLDTDGDGLDDIFDDNNTTEDVNDNLNMGASGTDNDDVRGTPEVDFREVMDYDMDGVVDTVDLDDDNDGIPDIVEAGGIIDPSADNDMDGVPNYLDQTDRGDGTAATCIDTTPMDGICDDNGLDLLFDIDGDGIPNHFDLDSDNDGIMDILEAGGIDINSDGEVDYPTPGDPTTMVDIDNDGLDDSLDNVGGTVIGGTPLSTPNSDGDVGNQFDFLDIDSDDDGIVDNIEGQPTVGYLPPSGNDEDDDGIDDQYDADCSIAVCGLLGIPIVPVNTDGLADGADYIDTDADNDGESDTIEGYDIDDDGVADTLPSGNDADNDGLDDSFDVDGMGITNAGGPTNGGQTASNPFPDTDSPGGEPNWREDRIELTLIKTSVLDLTIADGATTADVGDRITYTYAIQNTGDVTLTGVGVAETVFSGTGLIPVPGFVSNNGASPQGTLVAGEIATFSAVYILTQDDINAGGIQNSATATGTPPTVTGTPPATPITDVSDAGDDTLNEPGLDGTPDGDMDFENDPTVTLITPEGALTLVKTAGTLADTNGDGKIGTGDDITYSFEVTNTGNVSLNTVGITDSKITGAITLSATTLIPGAVATATATYTVVAGDETAGGIENTATATGTPPNLPDGTPGTLVTDVSDAGDDTLNEPDLNGTPDGDTDFENDPTVVIFPLPAEITFTKTAGAATIANGLDATIVDAGDTILYTLSVENTGSVAVTSVVVTDAKLGLTNAPVSAPNLAIGETGILTQSYTITQADIDAGGIENSATATATPPALPDGSAATPITDVSDAGDATLNEPGLDGTPDGDMDFENDPTVTLITPEGALTLIKTAGTLSDTNGDGDIGEGDDIVYSFEVANTGNVSLNTVGITDSKITGMITLSATTLAPGAVATATATYTVDADDETAGGVENTATVTGTPPDLPDGTPGTLVTDVSDAGDDTLNEPGLNGTPDGDTDFENDPTVVIFPLPAEITFTKTASAATITNGSDATIVDAGDVVTYTLSVENTGGAALTNVNITDAKLGLVNAPVTPPNLIAGATGIITFNYTITQEDVNAGGIENTAMATATPPDLPDGSAATPITDVSDGGDELVEEPLLDGNLPGDGTDNDPTVTLITSNSELTLTKVSNAAPDGAYDTIGEVITYMLEVTNTGNVTISGITITDDNADIGSIDISGIPASLEPGESAMATATHTITQADIDAGVVINSASVQGTPPNLPDGTPVSPITDVSDDPTIPDADDATVTETELAIAATLEITKVASTTTYTAIGDVITYTIVVTNTGSVNIENVVVTDDNAIFATGSNPVIGMMMPGDVVTLTATHAVVLSDITAETVINSAIVMGESPLGDMISDNSDDPNDPTDIDPDNDGNPDDPTVSGLDSDNDGIPNNDDLDDDNDGITDVEEMNNTPNLDTDSDGIVDRLDLESDGDGILDVYESGADLTGLTITPEGVIESPVGIDGIPDAVQPNDGENSGIVNYTILDTDGDGQDNFQDIDDDGDDTDSVDLLTSEESPDPNGDGNPDDAADVDNDGVPDYLEPNGIDPNSEDGISVYNAISPDGDGYNDVFVIRGLDKFKDNNLEVFNRWGVKVFEADGYGVNGNFFRGMSNGRATISETDQLPVGTYYYILKYVMPSGENKSRAGYIYINR